MIPLRDNIPSARTPVITYALIVANIVVYFFWQRGGIALGDASNAHYVCQLQDWAAIPYEITHPGDQVATTGCSPPNAPTWATIFTSAFMHGGLLHLAGNMLFLWIFGNNVEERMGPVRFLVFYVLAGVAALALHTIIAPGSQVPTLGASGAIAGVLGAYIVLFPRAKVVTVIFIVFFFTIVELPALLVLGAWFAMQALYGYFDLFGPSSGGAGVAYFAHIGGFVFGLVAVRWFARRKRPSPVLSRG